MMKKKIYFNEYNMPTGNTWYFPYSSGLLQAYSQQFDTINKNYEFCPIIFKRDTVTNLLKHYDNPSVAGFSVSVWNYQLSLEVARRVKEKFPKCLIIFGGPQAPREATQFFIDNPQVDLVVYKEGEELFKDILINHLNGTLNLKHHTLYLPQSTKDLDTFPSPYVSGVFDKILKDNPDLEFKAIMETARGCPFTCAYCFWGESTGVIKKIGFHSLKYLTDEADWFGKNKIKYIMCADANFGMYKQDQKIAQIYADTKKRHKGYPEKFRVDYGKNTTQNIFNTAKILKDADLVKTVTLSLQSNSQKVLNSIGRKNIKTEAFNQLREQYNRAGIPTYTEIILGLPSETKDSFLIGLDKALSTVKNNQLFIYPCQLLPNTKLNTKEYIEKFEFKTVTIPLKEGHGNVRPPEMVQEFEDIIIGTNTMSVEDWKECFTISLMVQLLHSLKLGYEIIEYLVKEYEISRIDFYQFLANNTFSPETAFLRKSCDDIVDGNSRCVEDKRYGDIYYEPEEIALLNILQNKDNFYNSFFIMIRRYLTHKHIEYSSTIEELKHVIKQTVNNLPSSKEFNSLEEFATYTILYGRKDNKLKKT